MSMGLSSSFIIMREIDYCCYCCSVITLALEALEFLSMYHSNRVVMLDELGLMDSIERILRGELGETKDREIATRIKKVC
jgi:hypothetical protein